MNDCLQAIKIFRFHLIRFPNVCPPPPPAPTHFYLSLSLLSLLYLCVPPSLSFSPFSLSLSRSQKREHCKTAHVSLTSGHLYLKGRPFIALTVYTYTIIGGYIVSLSRGHSVTSIIGGRRLCHYSAHKRADQGDAILTTAYLCYHLPQSSLSTVSARLSLALECIATAVTTKLYRRVPLGYTVSFTSKYNLLVHIE